MTKYFLENVSLVKVELKSVSRNSFYISYYIHSILHLDLKVKIIFYSIYPVFYRKFVVRRLVVSEMRQ